jgi:hypothetical protein
VSLRSPANEGVNLVPDAAIDDRLMLAGVRRALVHGVTEIHPVIEHTIEIALVDELAVLVQRAFLAQLRDQLLWRRTAREASEDRADEVCLALIDNELAVFDVVAERRPTAHPHSLSPRGGELVADTLADDLTFELGKGQENIKRQPTHRCCRVERLRDTDESDFVAVEDLHELGKIHQGAAEPVDLIDDDHVHLIDLDIGKKPFEGRALKRGPGNPAVVVAVGNQKPTLGALTYHICLTGLPLGIKAVEFLFETFLAGFARIDRAAQFACGWERGLHARPRVFLRPKNTRPFHRVPVMWRAIADSDLYGRP